jgi:hypothetical protein
VPRVTVDGSCRIDGCWLFLSRYFYSSCGRSADYIRLGLQQPESRFSYGITSVHIAGGKFLGGPVPRLLGEESRWHASVHSSS